MAFVDMRRRKLSSIPFVRLAHACSLAMTLNPMLVVCL